MRRSLIYLSRRISPSPPPFRYWLSIALAASCASQAEYECSWSRRDVDASGDDALHYRSSRTHSHHSLSSRLSIFCHSPIFGAHRRAARRAGELTLLRVFWTFQPPPISMPQRCRVINLIIGRLDFVAAASRKHSAHSPVRPSHR